MTIMTSPRLFSLLRLAVRTETFTVQAFTNRSTNRILCSGARWLSCAYNESDRNGCVSKGVVFHRPSLGNIHQFGVMSQTYRFNSQKVKEEPKSNPTADQSKEKTTNEADDLEQFQNLSLYGKVKAMYRDYWYVLVPVHLASSVVFFGSFYYVASSGVDIVAILESLHFSETIINTLKDSGAGHIAIAYALYKIFTPVRYTVTLGGTTWTIRILRARGLLKPRRPMKEAKENVQKIISAMKLPEQERQKFLEDKGLPRIGKAVGQASSAMSNISKKSDEGKK